MFHFRGPVLPSKSWLNRALVIRSFNPQLRLEASSDSEDVRFLEKALCSLKERTEFDLGLGGTTFRFFAFAVSRETGEFYLRAESRLLQRPQHEIVQILEQLGVEARLDQGGLRLVSRGWRSAGTVKVPAGNSSQFASGLILSCWHLDFDLDIEIRKPVNSFGYLKMTLDLVRKAGMRMRIEESPSALHLHIPRLQTASAVRLETELDISSAFSLIAAAVVNGEAEITNWNSRSLQPDLAFLPAFERMGLAFEIGEGSFRIEKQKHWEGLDFDLNDSPDLFPVLAVLCALGKGISNLTGAAQLKVKESDRIQKTRELLGLAGFKSEILEDGLRIEGMSSARDKKIIFEFDPDHDHRMAMAAGILMLAGYNIRLKSPEVVNKSYPAFWKDTGLQP